MTLARNEADRPGGTAARICLAALAALLVGAVPAHAADHGPSLPRRLGYLVVGAPEDPVERRNLRLLGVATAGVALYGALQWWNDGFETRFKTEREGWLGKGTTHGGIDKTGHAFSNYAGVRILTPLLESMGNDPDRALWLATGATVGAFALVEVLDGFSKAHRASHEDLLFNLLGAAGGVLMQRNPRLDALIDFRFGYRRDRQFSDRFDPFGDYEGQRFFIVFKADGVPALRTRPWLRFAELSIGYGIRGFSGDPGFALPRERQMYVGLSFNLSRLIAERHYDGRHRSTPIQQAIDVGLELFQPPIGVWRESRH